MKKRFQKVSLLTLLACSITGCNGEHDVYVTTRELIYNGDFQELVREEKQGVAGNFCYSLNGIDYSFEIPKAKDAGTYEISYFYVGSDNYKKSNINDARNINKISATIKKADILEDMFIEPVSADNETIDTDVELFTPGVCEYGTFEYSLDKVNWTEDVILANEPNEYDLYWYIKGDSNHNDFASQNAPNVANCQVNDDRELTFLTLNSSNDKLKTIRFHDTYGGSNTYTDDIQFNFEFQDLITLDNNTYNKNLASLGLALTAELYDYVSVDKKIGNEYSNEKFVSTLGLNDTILYSVDANSYITDKNDVATVELSHIEFVYENKNYQEFFVTFKGTDKNEEWASNFDIGYDCENYVNEVTKRDEWTNKNHHKGFDVAFNRIKTRIDKYLNDYKSSDATKILFISGHSRGGAMANLAGAHYSENSEFKTFAYTFAAPNITDEPTIKEYKNIFNVINSDDLICNIPLESLGFKRYGRDVTYKVSSNKNAADNFLNKGYSSVDVNGLLNLLGTIFDSRESLYDMPENYDDDLAYNKYDSEEKAQKGIITMHEELGEMFNRGNILISEPLLEDGKWYVRWKYSKAFILDVLGDLLVAESVISRIGILLYIPTPLNNFGLQLISLMVDSSGVSCAHLPDSYAIVVNNN